MILSGAQFGDFGSLGAEFCLFCSFCCLCCALLDFFLRMVVCSTLSHLSLHQTAAGILSSANRIISRHCTAPPPCHSSSSLPKGLPLSGLTSWLYPTLPSTLERFRPRFNTVLFSKSWTSQQFSAPGPSNLQATLRAVTAREHFFPSTSRETSAPRLIRVTVSPRTLHPSQYCSCIPSLVRFHGSSRLRRLVDLATSCFCQGLLDRS